MIRQKTEKINALPGFGYYYAPFNGFRACRIRRLCRGTDAQGATKEKGHTKIRRETAISRVYV